MADQLTRKIKEGIVTSTKMKKTVVVNVRRTIPHHIYKKMIHRDRKYYAHCDDESIVVGQKVKIKETRPLSKLKRWVVIKALP